MELREGTVVASRFRLVRQLGEGGMGMVWSAQHVGLDTPCALKFIHEEAAWDANHRARFEREARVVAQLRSPHVVQVLDYGVHEDVPYLAMELLDGEDLAERLARRGRLSAQETVSIVSQIARALTKAHAAELVHRDLKPENVFLVRDDDGEIVKVLDFGIAKTMTGGLGDQRTKTGALVGTPRFMSPEQAQGVKSVDHRSDLWSLGVIAYRCLTGRLPFDSDAIGDLLMRIIVHPLPVPSQAAPDVPPALDAWWLRAAARDPAQRFQSARDLSDALAGALGIAVPARPGSGAGAFQATEMGSAAHAPQGYTPQPSPAPYTPQPSPAPYMPVPSSGPHAPSSGPVQGSGPYMPVQGSGPHPSAQGSGPYMPVQGSGPYMPVQASSSAPSYAPAPHGSSAGAPSSHGGPPATFAGGPTFPGAAGAGSLAGSVRGAAPAPASRAPLAIAIAVAAALAGALGAVLMLTSTAEETSPASAASAQPVTLTETAMAASEPSAAVPVASASAAEPVAPPSATPPRATAAVATTKPTPAAPVPAAHTAAPPPATTQASTSRTGRVVIPPPPPP